MANSHPNGKNSNSVSSASPVPPSHFYTTQPRGSQSQTQANIPTYDRHPKAKRFPRLSRPVELLRHSYDVVVIGSGYGASVAASRMARAKQSVCVLEIGKERWPGEYPSSTIDALGEIHVSGNFAPKDERSKPVQLGNRTGLYHLVLGAGQNAFVGNGLGGTSLLNANVFLRADERTLAMQDWPVEIQRANSLEKYYQRATAMLEPEPYPTDFPEPHKLKVFRKQAQAMGLADKFSRAPQTTKFKSGPNSTGVEMQASSLTGQDSTGVNDGSKITTLVTYLADAWNWGAEIFCECEVRYIKKHPNEGYLVFFAWHGSRRAEFEEVFKTDLMWVHAKKFVFVGAGTLATTEIMLRSKQLGLAMSDRVGKDMSGNGDILAFGYNLDENVNSIGREFPLPDRPIGPTITGIIDCREQKEVLDGFVIEEGAVPQALAYALQPMLELLPGSQKPKDATLMQKVRRLIARLASFILGPYYSKGAVAKTQIYLIMSHDMNQAVLTLEGNKPSLEFLGVGRTDHLKQLNDFMVKLTQKMGGTFVNNPFFAKLNRQQITVHPIGGMNLSSDGTADEGVTTHIGEVLTGKNGDYHDGLVVVDGSLIPSALGVNPFATITALAERCLEGVATKKGITIDYHTKNGLLDLFGHPAYPAPKDQSLLAREDIIYQAQAAAQEGIFFTEVMKGFIHIGADIDDFDVAAEHAKSECADARFFLSVAAYDTDTFVSRPDHRANLTGTFSNSMAGSPFMVLRGDFGLFTQDASAPNQTNLTYDFDMIGTNGDIIHFNAKKKVNPSVAFSPVKTWQATSTLYVTLTRPDASLVGKGILYIEMRDFLDEMMTLRASGKSNSARFRSMLQFLTYFTKSVSHAFFALCNTLQWPSITYVADISTSDPNETHEVIASDGVKTQMHMWEPAPQAEPGKKVLNILWIPGAGVDHQIFALPTISKNAIGYFTAAGYRCWCITHRIGKTPVAEQGYTTYDARLDIQAALAIIRNKGPSREKVYVIAHCAGSVALGIGLLDGTIDASWILGITASNVFLHPEFARVNYIKAYFPLPLTKIYSKIAGPFYDTVSTQNDSWLQRTLTQLLRFYPMGSRSELCNSVVCHRASLVFGKLWSHRNLNEMTHAQLHRFLGGTSMASLRHLMRMGTAGRVLDNAGKDSLLTDANLERLRGIPIFLFSGVENTVYSPEATLTSYTALRTRFGEIGYERVEFVGRGHLDCWMGAAEAGKGGVYEIVRKKMERVIALGQNGLTGGLWSAGKAKGKEYETMESGVKIDGASDIAV